MSEPENEYLNLNKLADMLFWTHIYILMRKDCILNFAGIPLNCKYFLLFAFGA